MLEKLKKNYFILIITFLFIYFFFNLLDGDRGLISYMEKKDIYEQLKNDQITLNSKIEDLEHKNSLLTENIDLDFIEILIREKFLFGKEGETTYIIKDYENQKKTKTP
jgi:cell division protein DivIC